MPETIKDHTTVTITLEMLDKLKPCPSGRAGALPFLPAVFSTDPHDNLKLAEKWTRAERAQDGYADLYWFASRFRVEGERMATEPDCSDFPKHDAWVAAQYMAMVADVIATKEGR